MEKIDKEHLVNCNEDIMGESIYRVFKIEHLFEWFKTGKVAFCRPDKWEDPWEASLFKDNGFYLRKDLKAILPISNLFYAQCWTYVENETDLIWKLYSPQKKSVRIKTSVGKLYDNIITSKEFMDFNHKYHNPECFMGKVIYNKDSEIKKITNEIKKHFNGKYKLKNKKLRINKPTIQYLFKKRKAFFHEKEFRFVFCTNDFNHLFSNTAKLNYFSINPHEIINEILFDPRMDQNLVNCYKDHIQLICGFNKKIEQSSLYKI